MNKEQMEMLKRTANTMMMMAKAMKEAGLEEQSKNYARRGANACRLLIQAEKEWDDDSTGTIYFSLRIAA